jgi:hypothetical protein
MAQTVILLGGSQRALACDLIRRAPVYAVVTIKEATRNLDQNPKPQQDTAAMLGDEIPHQ